MKAKLCVLRRSCEDFNSVLHAHEQGISVVCGRCKAPIMFVLKDEAIKQGVNCSASCSKDESHVNITWRAQKREKPFWEQFEERVAELRDEQSKHDASKEEQADEQH